MRFSTSQTLERWKDGVVAVSVVETPVHRGNKGEILVHSRG